MHYFQFNIGDYASHTRHLSLLEDWSTAMAAIYNSKFLCRENDRGWKADFDFLLQPKSFVKLLEGAYNK